MHIGIEKCATGYKTLNFAVKSRCGLFYIAPRTAKHIVSIVEGLVARKIVRSFNKVNFCLI